MSNKLQAEGYPPIALAAMSKSSPPCVGGPGGRVFLKNYNRIYFTKKIITISKNICLFYVTRDLDLLD